MKISIILRLLKSSILSSTSFQMDINFWGVVSAAVVQSRHIAKKVAQGDRKFGLPGWHQNPSKKLKKSIPVTNLFPFQIALEPLVRRSLRDGKWGTVWILGVGPCWASCPQSESQGAWISASAGRQRQSQETGACQHWPALEWNENVLNK